MLVWLLCHSLLLAQPPVTALTWTPAEDQLVVGSQAGVAVVAGDDLRRVGELKVELDNVHALAFSPAGDKLLVAGGSPAEQGVVLVLDWPACQVISRYEAHADVVYEVIWIDEDTWASAAADGLARVWKLNSREPVGELVGHSQAVTGLVFVSERLITSSADQSLRTWSWPRGELQRTLDQHTAPVLAISRRPAADEAGAVNAGRSPVEVASISRDRTIRLWQPSIGRMVRFARLPQVPLCLAWMPQSLLIATGCDDGHVRLIDPQTAAIVHDERLCDGWLHCIATTADGRVVAGGPRGELYRVNWKPGARP